MEFIKRILGIATFIAMICGIVFLSNLFAKLDDAVKFSILGVIVLIIICTWISRRISHRKKANMLTQEFLCGKHNEAVEYALSRPQRERMRLTAKLEGYIESRLNSFKWDCEKENMYYVRYLLEKLYVLNEDKAIKFLQKIREQSLSLLSEMINNEADFQLIIRYINSCTSKNSITTCLNKHISLNTYYKQITMTVRPYIKSVADLMQNGKSYEFKLYYYFTAGGMRLTFDNYCISITLTDKSITYGKLKVPITNYIIDSSETAPVATLFFNAQNIYDHAPVEPIQNIINYLIEELINRLPENERKPAADVYESVSQRRYEQKMDAIDFQNKVRYIQQEEERMIRESEALNTVYP